MKLAEATAGFLESIRQTPATVAPQLQPPTYERATQLLISYYSADSLLNDLTAEGLRDFLARWYLEKACTSKLNVSGRDFSDPNASESIERALTAESGFSTSDLPHSDQLPPTTQLLASLTDFLKWVDENTGEELTARCSQTLTELDETLPQAIEITRLLSSWIQERRGAFSFPEFLTSFEEGGSSQYDIDTPGNIGALEGYFRIIRVEGSLVEAEDLISEERVWPIAFPPEVAMLLDRPYVINLELLRTQEGWHIASCGFAYPPGTEI
jgi:hypothetical protein